jgi:hypothetical protein
MTRASKMADSEAIKVEVINAEDMRVMQTEEHEPEHFVCNTFVLQIGDPNQPDENPQNQYASVLQLDPQRKSASIMTIDNPIVICHSENQANSPANQVPGIPAPDGVVLAVGQSVSVTGTAPLWAVATATGNSRVSVIVNRRGA